MTKSDSGFPADRRIGLELIRRLLRPSSSGSMVVFRVGVRIFLGQAYLAPELTTKKVPWPASPGSRAGPTSLESTPHANTYSPRKFISHCTLQKGLRS